MTFIEFKNFTSFLLSLFLFSIISSNVVLSNPDIQFYNIDVRVNKEGTSNVQLVINFEQPEDTFSMGIIGRIDNFEASSNSGPVDCHVSVSGTSLIECEMDLTDTKKELQMNFTTNDFVKVLDEKMYFRADLSPNIPVKGITASLKLPAGALLAGDNISSSIISYTQNASAHIVGDSILVAWTLHNTKSSDSLEFEVLYEYIESSEWFGFGMMHFILLGGSFAAVLGVIVFYYLRKSRNVVLSVLDEYERKVMDIVTKEGEVKQKQVVQQTNLSKAKVSRVVKSLVQRGLIESERRGRTNKLRPVKKNVKV